MLVCLRLFDGLLLAAGLEWNAPSKSAFSTTAILLFYELGLMLLPGLAYLVGNWRKLLVVLFSPLIVVWGLAYWSAAA